MEQDDDDLAIVFAGSNAHATCASTASCKQAAEAVTIDEYFTLLYCICAAEEIDRRLPPPLSLLAKVFEKKRKGKNQIKSLSTKKSDRWRRRRQ